MLRTALAASFLTTLVVSTGAGSAPRADAPRNSVGTLALKNAAVTAAKLRRGAVTSVAVRDRSLLAIDFGVG